MTRKQKRLVLIGLAGAVIAIAGSLVLYALNDKIVFFNSPSDIVARHPAAGVRIRLGGLVKEGTVVRGKDAEVAFEVTDTINAVPVSFSGILPDLFREGQGVIAEGSFEPSGKFRADTVLAKHDERYMPKEVVDSLKKSGRWQEGATQ